MSGPKTVTRPSDNAAESPTKEPAAAAVPLTPEQEEAEKKARVEKQAKEEEAELKAMEEEEQALLRRKEIATKKRDAAERVNKLREETALVESAAATAELKAAAPSKILYRDPSKIKELNDELALSKRVQEEAFRASRDARQDSVTRQARANGGEVDHDLANKDAEKAAETVRRKAYQGRPKGIYVLSNLETSSPDGFTRVTLTPGTRVPDGMLDHYTPAELEKLFEDQILEDRR
jgi:hypothetical protein